MTRSSVAAGVVVALAATPCWALSISERTRRQS